ncbi:MAG: hypothetical protein NT040_04520 [Bacteroidetes bacterium]|nr:hypothetical protein [Bacteroidota bacterium]
MPADEYREAIASGILEILGYFGLFRYPLLPAEIHRFSLCRCTPEETMNTLDGMTARGEVVRSPEGFYSIGVHEDWSFGRIAGNRRAGAILSRSMRFTRIIRSFPFVDAIAISGSLSKYYAGEDADTDYFIITEKNRMWIARSLLHIFKKLTFIPGYQHWFCMNYFIDTEALVMADHNVYTAIELATLIPVYNKERISQLKSANTWIEAFLPNETNSQDLAYLESAGKQRARHLAERTISLLCPERLNAFLMRLTDRKWRKKWRRRGFPMADYERAFHTSLHVSKNHPADFQKRILSALETKTELTGI